MKEILSWTITRRSLSMETYSSNSTLSGLSSITFFRTGNEPSQQSQTKWSWTAPRLVRLMTTRGLCQLQIGTYQGHWQWVNNKAICHLPLWRLNPMLLAVAVDLQQTRWEFRVEWGTLGLQNHWRWCLQPWNEKTLAPWKKSYDQPRQHIKKQ